MKTSVRVGVASLVFILRVYTAFAGTTTVQGVVVDDSGLPLPGVVVVLTSHDGGNPREATTDRLGVFGFRDVPAGAAQVHAELPGFLPLDMKASIGDGDENMLTLRMKIGFAQEVTVVAESGGGVLAPTRNADAVEFDSESLRRLPSDSQDVQAIVDAFTASAPVGGASIVVDGIETDGAAIPAAAIHRAAINRSPYAADFKSPGKARVEIETDRGSRRFYHGSGAMFLRNGALEARNAFATTDPQTSRALGEGTMGGPLPRRKWSFFVSGQRLADDNVAVINALTPGGAMIASAPTGERRASTFSRIDFRPNDTDALMFGYDLVDAGQSSRGVGGLRLAETAYSTAERRHRVQVSDHRLTSAGLLNDLRVEISAADRREGSASTSPSVVVAGAFTAGPSPIFTRNDSTAVQIQDVVTATIAAHTVRIGARAKPRETALTDGTNFAGTYVFRDLAEYAVAHPVLLTQRSGNANVSFADVEGDLFAESEFRPLASLAITAGLRYDWQARIADRRNVAPRVSAAFAPAGRRVVVRAGFGRFFQSVPQHVLARAQLFGDNGVREVSVASPLYPTLPARLDTEAPGAAWMLSPDLRSPATTQTSVSVERAFGVKSTVSAEYMHLETSGGLRTLDVNAPRLATGLRPDALRLNLFAIGSTGSSRTDALTVTARSRIDAFRATVQYTLGRTFDDGSGPFDLPADSGNPGAEWGRADFDRRHRLNVAATYGWFEDRVRLGGVLVASSGAPYDIQTGADDNHDLVVNDRPLGVGRNSGDGPAFAQLDLRFTTVFRTPRPPSADPRSTKRERIDNLELNLDVFNAFDRLNAPTYIGIVTSPLFGRANTARMPRTAQLSVRYRF
jgi:Carboxypeptidase regulatory-like domain/TonB dependent receptor